jgi:hypothetical protein
MADRVEIQCIRKNDRQSAYERIAFVGGVHRGQTWKLSLDEAIKGIEAGKWDFYSDVDGDEVGVIISSKNGRKYLKTVADGDEPNNLLSLPNCP